MAHLTTLEAVNRILVASTESPATALDTNGTSPVGEAETELDFARREIQGKGYHVNIENDITLEPADYLIELDGAATGTFLIGETVTGDSTSATATIVYSDPSGTDDLLYALAVSGVITAADALTGGTSGATADVDVVTAITDSPISLPADIISVDTWGTSEWVDVAFRGARLYDRDNNTYTFSSELKVTQTRMLDFDGLPFGMQSWIIAHAAVSYQWTHVGDPQAHAVLSRKLEESQLAAVKDDTERSNVNILQTRHAQSILGTGTVAPRVR